MVEPLLAVSGLKTYFPIGNRWLGKQQWFKAVDDVTFAIRPGETLGLVGESGSGKTTLGRSVLRLVEPNAGSVSFDGTNVLDLNPRDLRALRRRMQMIFQDTFGSLNPRMRITQIVGEPLRHFDIVPRHQVEDQVVSLLDKVGVEPDMMARFPHELSGGQRQRIVIARALALEPDFIVADEPVSALDVSVQAQILNLLLELQRKDRITMLLISHDFGVVERIADRVAVMYQGRIVEEAETGQLISNPQHAYTKVLLSAAVASTTFA